MNKHFVLAFAISILLVGAFTFFDSTNKNSFSCDNLGTLYIKQSEINSVKPIKDAGVIVKIPKEPFDSKLDMVIANSNVLNCQTIDLYLEEFKY